MPPPLPDRKTLRQTLLAQPPNPRVSNPKSASDPRASCGDARARATPQDERYVDGFFTFTVCPAPPAPSPRARCPWVREGYRAPAGRDVSTQYGEKDATCPLGTGGKGGGGAPRVLLLTGRPRAALGPPARRTSLTGRGPQALCPCEISFLMRSSFFEILKRSRSSRTKWTRLVPRPVLTGHASSLLPY